MHGKYVDQRVYQHFVHTYSRVPYLDREIFNVENDALRLSRRADKRANEAKEGKYLLTQVCKRFSRNLAYSSTLWEIPETEEKSKLPSSSLTSKSLKNIALKKRSYCGVDTVRRRKRKIWITSETKNISTICSSPHQRKLTVEEPL